MCLVQLLLSRKSQQRWEPIQKNDEVKETQTF